MKRCDQCGGKLGLGVKFRNLWNGQWWIHLRFCSALCEHDSELERRTAIGRNVWHGLQPRASQ